MDEGSTSDDSMGMDSALSRSGVSRPVTPRDLGREVLDQLDAVLGQEHDGLPMPMPPPSPPGQSPAFPVLPVPSAPPGVAVPMPPPYMVYAGQGVPMPPPPGHYPHIEPPNAHAQDNRNVWGAINMRENEQELQQPDAEVTAQGNLRGAGETPDIGRSQHQNGYGIQDMMQFQMQFMLEQQKQNQEFMLKAMSDARVPTPQVPSRKAIGLDGERHADTDVANVVGKLTYSLSASSDQLYRIWDQWWFKYSFYLNGRSQHSEKIIEKVVQVVKTAVGRYHGATNPALRAQVAPDHKELSGELDRHEADA